MTPEQYEAFRTFPIGGILYNRLRLAMALEGLSIMQLARLSKVSRMSIYHALNGNETMRVETAKKLADALEVNIEDLFPGPELWPKTETNGSL